AQETLHRHAAHAEGNDQKTPGPNPMRPTVHQSGYGCAAAPAIHSVLCFHPCQKYYPFLAAGAVELWASAACPSACASARRTVHQACQIHQPKNSIETNMIVDIIASN